MLVHDSNFTAQVIGCCCYIREGLNLPYLQARVSTRLSDLCARYSLLVYVLNCLGFMPRCRSSPASSTSPTSPWETTRSSSTEEARFSSLFTKSRIPILAEESSSQSAFETVNPATDLVESWPCRVRIEAVCKCRATTKGADRKDQSGGNKFTCKRATLGLDAAYKRGTSTPPHFGKPIHCPESYIQ